MNFQPCPNTTRADEGLFFETQHDFNKNGKDGEHFHTADYARPVG